MTDTFMTAEQLHVIPAVREAAIVVLGRMESGHYRHTPNVDEDRPGGVMFNMAHWYLKYDCGTVVCMGGAIEVLMLESDPLRFATKRLERLDAWVTNQEFSPYNHNSPLHLLFFQDSTKDVTVEQAARRMRNWLETGHPEREER